MGQGKIKRQKRKNLQAYEKKANLQLRIHNTILQKMKLRHRLKYALYLIFKKLNHV